ncbi:hypothetical protein, partial [Aerosakkonema funiforme]|uniref:hypothetical protein n=1 Tax=Aerosakkonema funiforme TaxID=1246630 RepID=UPI0035B6B37A
HLVLLLFSFKFCLKYQHTYASSSGISIAPIKKAALKGRGFRPIIFGKATIPPIYQVTHS